MRRVRSTEHVANEETSGLFGLVPEATRRMQRREGDCIQHGGLGRILHGIRSGLLEPGQDLVLDRGFCVGDGLLDNGIGRVCPGVVTGPGRHVHWFGQVVIWGDENTKAMPGVDVAIRKHDSGAGWHVPTVERVCKGHLFSHGVRRNAEKAVAHGDHVRHVVVALHEGALGAVLAGLVEGKLSAGLVRPRSGAVGGICQVRVGLVFVRDSARGDARATVLCVGDCSKLLQVVIGVRVLHDAANAANVASRSCARWVILLARHVDGAFSSPHAGGLLVGEGVGRDAEVERLRNVVPALLGLDHAGNRLVASHHRVLARLGTAHRSQGKGVAHDVLVFLHVHLG
mmetsp:Transcript_2413/g.7024  ORF Transcript_2413/g.7024 Transcript_2413/m.7024 type:complete len:342 (+) Transcript_2413:158-1183(+)